MGSSSELTAWLDRLRLGADLVSAAIADVADEEIDWPPGPAKWTLRQVLCHLADSEAVGVMRLRQVLAEENPVIQWYDEQAWGERTDYHRRDWKVALATFLLLRQQNYELLAGVDGAAWSRTGTHTKTGTKTLFDLLRIYAEHAEGHARQMQNVRAGYKDSR